MSNDLFFNPQQFYGLTLNQEQIEFVNAIFNPDNLCVVCNARAGTGKTLLSLGAANLLYQKGLYEKIYYIVSPTQEQIQGYLPGNQEEKSAVYSEPMEQALITLGINPHVAVISENNLQAQKDGRAYISFRTHTYMRGVNISRAVVIVDESQNAYTDSLKKILTRIHDDCKTIVVGHSGQVDIIKHPERSGFTKFIKLVEDRQPDFIELCNLSINHRGKLSLFADDL